MEQVLKHALHALLRFQWSTLNLFHCGQVSQSLFRLQKNVCVLCKIINRHNRLPDKNINQKKMTNGYFSENKVWIMEDCWAKLKCNTLIKKVVKLGRAQLSF
jgi:hypothetical protein